MESGPLMQKSHDWQFLQSARFFLRNSRQESVFAETMTHSYTRGSDASKYHFWMKKVRKSPRLEILSNNVAFGIFSQ